MEISKNFEFPDELQKDYQKAKKLEWWTIFFLIIDIIIMAIVMGSSQAMKTAWMENVLSLIPPIVFLISSKIFQKPPDKEHQYGFHRVTTIAFLTGSVALVGMGLFLFYESVEKFITAEHPSIGTVNLFGQTFWLGYLMVASLIWSATPPIFLGRMKEPLAKKLHDKTLHTDADMNKADWMTALAGIFGVLGIGYGIWWTDALGAAIISLDIFHDGITNLKDSIMDLMDRIPKKTGEDRIEEVIFKAKNKLNEFDWIEDAEIRMREEGHVFFGDAFVVVKKGISDLNNLLEKAQKSLYKLDWRIHDIVIMPVNEIPKKLAENVFINKNDVKEN